MSVCGDCRFYDHELENEGKKFGFCFRYPPTVVADNKSTTPIVRRDLRSCGEFKPKTKPPTKSKARRRK